MRPLQFPFSPRTALRKTHYGKNYPFLLDKLR